MKYKVSKILSTTLTLPLILGLNISQSFAATAGDKIEAGKEAIANNSQSNLIVAESDEMSTFSPKIPTFLTEFLRTLSLDELGIESPNQERLLIAEDYQSKECRRYGICE